MSVKLLLPFKRCMSDLRSVVNVMRRRAFFSIRVGSVQVCGVRNVKTIGGSRELRGSGQ